MSVVILGSGVIGVSTAYYLSELILATDIHLVDASPRLFASASGYAAGFLAADWFSPASAALGQLSFDEHKRLADRHGGREKWNYLAGSGYNYVPPDVIGNKRGDDWLRDGTSRAQVANAEFEKIADKDLPGWLNHHQGTVEIIGEAGSTAVVDPLKLCQFLLSECTNRGVNVHYPYSATTLEANESGEITGLALHSSAKGNLHLPCTKLVVSAGSWSPRVFATLFPESLTKIPISSLAGHSVVVRSPRWTKEHESHGSHAVFTTDSDDDLSPEIFSRPGEEIWCGGLNHAELPLPERPTDFAPDDASIERLLVASRKLVGVPPGQSDDLIILRKGLCSRPASAKGTPFISRIEDEKLGGPRFPEGGVFLSSGHGPWGISLSLGTGKVTAELVEGRRTSADISRLGL
ncbi:hypothetical protein AAFC00_001070 [Neodothiora populina]|uniref:FAD dependent oxidoreductase domain-containing protein n=1 Tax=Neodothiora populina TaxID=2781224 RepID=A0ABR3PMQ6_9PEZI